MPKFCLLRAHLRTPSNVGSNGKCLSCYRIGERERSRIKRLKSQIKLPKHVIKQEYYSGADAEMLLQLQVRLETALPWERRAYLEQMARLKKRLSSETFAQGQDQSSDPIHGGDDPPMQP